jgi:hypothetical protein
MIHCGFRSLISRYPLSKNLPSLNGSAGCLLCSVHEASEIYLIPRGFVRRREARYPGQLPVGTIWGDWKANELRRNRLNE